MEDTSISNHPLKKMDRAIFEQIDRFKTSPNYAAITDFYNNLEEEQQKLLKGGIILVLFLVPVIFLSALWWQNKNIRADYDLRVSIMNKAQQIIGESRGVTAIGPQLISQAPIDSEGMLFSRISNAVAGMGISGGNPPKIQTTEFTTTNVSEKILQAEGLINFTNLSNDELINLFSSLITREKMRISEVSIERNPDTNLLVGSFRLIHLAMIPQTEGE